jgi:uncharacterized protein (DUF697 family)
VRRIADLGLPVIIVITQVPFRDGRAHPEAVEFADFITQCALPVHPDGRPVLTNAVHDPFTDSPVAGLHELLDVTYAIVPEAVEGALTAAQRLDLERKKKAVAAVIRQAVAVASGVGAAPIPFADAALLVPNQVTMIARITAAYGLPASTSRTMAIAGSVVLTGGATMAGRYAVTNLLKFVPGGQIAGSAISATVAAALTKAVGVAWSRVCEYALTMDPQQRDAFLSSGAVSEVFRRFMRQPGDGVSVEP